MEVIKGNEVDTSTDFFFHIKYIMVCTRNYLFT